MSYLNNLKQQLARLKPQLVEQFGVHTLGLFGSVVRADFSPASDVDIIVEFSRPVGVEFIDLGDFLEKVIQRKVDLVSRRGVKESYLKTFEKEIVYV